MHTGRYIYMIIYVYMMYHHILEMMNSPHPRQARLLDSGATMRPREASSDDERSDDEEAGFTGPLG
jgi:hypothetical protein